MNPKPFHSGSTMPIAVLRLRSVKNEFSPSAPISNWPLIFEHPFAETQSELAQSAIVVAAAHC
jgi:hypothetical protein